MLAMYLIFWAFAGLPVLFLFSFLSGYTKLPATSSAVRTLTRLSRFSQAKFFRKIAICCNINQLENFGCFDEKYNLLIIKGIKFWVQM